MKDKANQIARGLDILSRYAGNEEETVLVNATLYTIVAGFKGMAEKGEESALMVARGWHWNPLFEYWEYQT